MQADQVACFWHCCVHVQHPSGREITTNLVDATVFFGKGESCAQLCVCMCGSFMKPITFTWGLCSLLVGCMHMNVKLGERMVLVFCVGLIYGLDKTLGVH